ncbi:hypothetical protein [Chryseobacterium rhizosphaerae]|uniref:Uncharacterized protein n=1 Tax=Chryseobacterium rhizosphaerae TaxID=395937 RepID=A0ABX9IIM2_9FLAO|nr:hypothetical protein [Chryseobacterium rhizosphaerae]REC74402.1 hypothetical protein DRF57_14175 [Chryseobacterium rhizosphaerae]GEN68238.1 hypothetical protein CRH01_28060 [Chryseobacterium rhizosphaerae]
MNQNIINQYSISFQNRVDNWDIFGKEINKIITTNNKYLTSFLISWNSVEQINNSLLPDINQALISPNIEVDSDSATVDIIMFNNLVDFYDDSNGYVNSIPLQDFKEIVTGWRDFLKTLPLGGSKV